MLTIYTSKSKAEEYSKLDIVPDIEARFHLRFVDKNMFSDAVSDRILREIEGMSERHGNGYILGKFGEVSLNDISTGGKGLLLAANYHDEFIINIDELGYNCIFLLFDIAKKIDIEVISTRTLYHMQDDFEAVVNDRKCKGKEISRQMEACDE